MRISRGKATAETRAGCGSSWSVTESGEAGCWEMRCTQCGDTARNAGALALVAGETGGLE